MGFQQKRFIRMLSQFLRDDHLDAEAFDREYPIDPTGGDPGIHPDKQRVYEEMNQFLDTRIRPAARPWFRRVTWLAVAASLTVACITGTYLWMHRQQHPIDPTLADLRHDIDPGGQRARLVLGNGRAVQLDDQQAGTIAEQSGLRIVKDADGNVIYEDLGESNISTKSPVENQLIVPRGGHYTVSLPDGTRVQLNSESRLVYPTRFTGKTRTVRLWGEAYFDVAHDASMPFEVFSGATKTTVLGTRFNIRAYGAGAVETTLIEGSVNFQTGRQAHVLQPGETAINAADGVINVGRAHTERILAWTQGYFYFEDNTITEIMEMLARWYDMEVQYQEGLSDLRFSGMVSMNKPISTILNIIERTEAISFDIKNNMQERRVVVMRK
ncbi:FecR family protein [Parapedobacter sp. DT-150]|uniref:FecR family protein n=1 Tax=Parapedobacter sp. DT-150 TaxID=3396162 RepID=UPI003F1A24FF